MEDVIASVDIGATNITATLCSKDGILARLYQRVCLEGDETTIPKQIRSLIDRCFAETGKDQGNLLAVGISSAGPFLKVDGMIEVICHNLCGGITPDRGLIPNSWRSVPLERELRRYYRQLKIENDAVAGTIAESTFGAGQGQDNLLYVTWSTGIGTGALVDGRLIKGKNGNAPHGGHVYLGDSGPMCGCGNVCDLESVASGTAIALQYGEGSTTADVFKAYYNGDGKAKDLIEKAAGYFARGLASINSILDTKMIVIGGSVFLNHKDLLLPMVKDEFYRSFPALTRDVVFSSTELGEYLGDVAAISLVIPEDWIEEWRRSKPWERAPATIYLDR
jgi:glucokinase